MAGDDPLRPWLVRAEQTLAARPPFIEVGVQTVQLPEATCPQHGGRGSAWRTVDVPPERQ